MKFLHQLLMILALCLLSPSAFSQENSPFEAGASAPAGETTGFTSDGAASGSEEEMEQAPLYSGKFNTMVWVSGVLLGGIGSFFVFLALHNHKRVRLAGDQHWPMLYTVTVPFLVLILPILFPANPVLDYGDWGSKCFDAATYPSRKPEPDPNGLLTVADRCIAAQSSPGERVSHPALGMNRVFEQYKAAFANGIGNAMFPGEMLFVMWLLVSLVGLSIYQALLGIRRRFFVH